MGKEYYAMIRRSTNELRHYGRMGMKKGQHIFGDDDENTISRNVSGNFTEKAEKLKQIITEKTSEGSGTVYKNRPSSAAMEARKDAYRAMNQKRKQKNAEERKQSHRESINAAKAAMRENNGKRKKSSESGMNAWKRRKGK